MVKHVIFDCDGVLVDTEIVAAKTVTKILGDHGIDVSVNEYIRTYTGRVLSGIYRDLLALTENEITRLVHKTDHDIYDQLVPIAGMGEVVRAISLNKSIASNSALWQVEKALDMTNLKKYFVNQFSAQMVANPKPAPDIYLLAAKENAVAPEECLVIEDSKSGVSAAVAAGMKVIGFTGASHVLPGHDETLREKGAITTANTPSKLLLEIRNYL